MSVFESSVRTTDPSRLLGIYNPSSGRAEDAEAHLKELECDFDIARMETVAYDPQANARNLLSVVREKQPDVLVSLGGDNTALTVVEAHFLASVEKPEILDIPLAFLPYGTGNDFPLSLTKHEDLRRILSNGKIVGYQPIEMSLSAPGKIPIVRYAAGSAGIGAIGNSAYHINHEDTHGHEDFKHPAKKHLLLARAASKGYFEAEPFMMQSKGPDGEFGPERLTTEHIFFHALRFAIHGRSKARITDDYLREAVLHRKWSPRTAFYMGCFLAGRAGVRIPSHVVGEARTFRVAPSEGQQLYAHLDDTELPIAPDTEIDIRLSDKLAKVLATRRRP